MPYITARTPSFVDPATYGMPKKQDPFSPPWRKPQPPPDLEPPNVFAPTWRSTLSAPQINEAAAMPPPSPVPQAPPPLDDVPQPKPWTTADQAIDTSQRAKNLYQQYGEMATKPPVLEHKQKGFKKVLHTLGDMFINPEIMHPIYSQQVQDYEKGMEALGSAAKATQAQAEEERKQAAQERQEATSAEQMETEKRRQEQITQPEPKAPTSISGPSYWDPVEQKLKSNPYYDERAEREPAGSAYIFKQMQRRKELQSKPALMPDEQLELAAIDEFLKMEMLKAQNMQAGIAARGAETGLATARANEMRSEAQVEKAANAFQAQASGDYVKASQLARDAGDVNAAALLDDRAVKANRGKKASRLFDALSGGGAPPAPAVKPPAAPQSPAVPSDPLGLFK